MRAHGNEEFGEQCAFGTYRERQAVRTSVLLPQLCLLFCPGWMAEWIGLLVADKSSFRARQLSFLSLSLRPEGHPMPPTDPHTSIKICSCVLSFEGTLASCVFCAAQICKLILCLWEKFLSEWVYPDEDAKWKHADSLFCFICVYLHL